MLQSIVSVLLYMFEKMQHCPKINLPNTADHFYQIQVHKCNPEWG